MGGNYKASHLKKTTVQSHGAVRLAGCGENAARDWRDERDGRDVSDARRARMAGRARWAGASCQARTDVLCSKFRKPRTSNLEPSPLPLFPSSSNSEPGTQNSELLYPLASPARPASRAAREKGKRKAETHTTGFGFSRRVAVLVQTHLLSTAAARPP